MEGIGINWGLLIAQIINLAVVCVAILIIGFVVYRVIKSMNRPPSDKGMPPSGNLDQEN